MFYSKFLYKITKSDSTAPGESVVCRWIEKIATNLRLVITYTPRLHTVLVRRANYLWQKVKRMLGSVPKQKLLQQSWEVKLEDDELVNLQQNVANLEEQVAELREENEDCRCLWMWYYWRWRNMKENCRLIWTRFWHKKERLQKKACDLSKAARGHQGRGGSLKSLDEYSQVSPMTIEVQGCDDSLFFGFSMRDSY